MNDEVGLQSAVLASGVVPLRVHRRRIGRSLFCAKPQMQRTANELQGLGRIHQRLDRLRFRRR